MLPQVFQALKASSAVKAIVGTNAPRIWRNSVSKDEPRPLNRAFITWFVISGVPHNNLSDPPPSDRDTVQVDLYHPDQKGLDLLTVAARDALEVVGVVTGMVIDQQDAETQLFRRALQADIFTPH